MCGFFFFVLFCFVLFCFVFVFVLGFCSCCCFCFLVASISTGTVYSQREQCVRETSRGREMALTFPGEEQLMHLNQPGQGEVTRFTSACFSAVLFLWGEGGVGCLFICVTCLFA